MSYLMWVHLLAPPKKLQVRFEMGVIKLVEGDSLTWSEWSAKLESESSCLDYLISARILRPADGGRLDLTFVGIVVFPNFLLFACPKFGGGNGFDLPGTIRILRNYFARSAFRRPTVDNQLDPEYGNSEVLREYDALLSLQEWFYSHGLYRREQVRVSDQGRPHWARTIAKCFPILIQGAAIYPSVIAERREGVLNEISALQVGILRRLQERYDLVTPAVVEQAEGATGFLVPQWPIPEDRRAYLDRLLALEQRGVYRTDALRLLKLLRELLGSRLAGAVSKPQIYGTTSFYSVWEDACRMAIGADSQIDPISSIGQPVWWCSGSPGHKVRYDHKQIPDIVVVRGAWHLIVDAKYYYRFPIARPGGPDIVKQLYYIESLRTPEASVLSIFLVPLPGADQPAFLGYSTIEGAHRQFPKIEAWGIEPAHLFSSYPTISASTTCDLIDFILSQRSRVTEFIDQPPPDIGG